MAAREFTKDEILHIRELAAQGHSAPIISRLYPEVGLETLRRIIRRETYREIGDVAPQLVRPGVNARLAGAGEPKPLTDLEREALESLRRLAGEGGEAAPPEEADPVKNFLGIRREPKV